jgi:hypothetical protein
MRLLRKVSKLEGTLRAKSKRREGVVWGLVWSQDEKLLGRELGCGETLAVDVHVVDDLHGVRVVRMVERATSNPADLGLVFDASGFVTGRVEERDGSALVTISDVAKTLPPAAG